MHIYDKTHANDLSIFLYLGRLWVANLKAPWHVERGRVWGQGKSTFNGTSPCFLNKEPHIFYFALAPTNFGAALLLGEAGTRFYGVCDQAPDLFFTEN